MRAARHCGWICLFGLPTLCPQVTAADYVALAPYLRTNPVRHLRPVLEEVNKELAQADKHLTTGGVGIRLLSWGAHGPGFLQYGVEGDSLGCFAVVYLGEVPVNLDTPGYAADDIILRIESYLTAVRRAGAADETDKWRFSRQEGVDAGGKLQHRSQTHDLLVAALQHVYDRRSHGAVLTAADGRKIPNLLGPRQIAVLDLTRARYFSTQLQYRPEMFPGIRSVTLLFYFLADLRFRGGTDRRPRAVTDVQLLPTDTRAGMVLKPAAEILQALFAGPASARRFVQRVFVPSGDDLEELRIRFSQRLLEAGRRDLARDERIAALKRLHQSMDGVGPALPAHRRMMLAEHIGAGLRSDAALLAGGIAALAQVLREVVASPDDYAAFRQAGDLEDVLGWIEESNEKLSRQHPELARIEALRLAEALQRLDFQAQPTPAQVNQYLSALEEARHAATRLSRLIGPSDYRTRCLLQSLESFHENVGYRRVRQWVLPDGAIGVARQDVMFVGAPFAGSDFEASPLPPVPGLTYRLLDEADVPRNVQGQPTEPGAVRYLLLGGGSRQRRAHDRMIADLKRADEAFDLRTWSGERKQLKLPWERKKK